MKLAEVSDPKDFLKKMKDPSELILRGKAKALQAEVERDFKTMKFDWSVTLDVDDEAAGTYLLTITLYSPNASKLRGADLIKLANLVSMGMQTKFGPLSQIQTQANGDDKFLFGAVVK